MTEPTLAEAESAWNEAYEERLDAQRELLEADDALARAEHALYDARDREHEEESKGCGRRNCGGGW